MAASQPPLPASDLGAAQATPAAPQTAPDTTVLRLFFALWPDSATRSALVALQRQVDGVPTVPQNLHLTLAFLGHQPAATLPLLQALLARLPAAAQTLPLDRYGYFSRPRIAWIGPAYTPPALLGLYQMLQQALSGVATETAAATVPRPAAPGHALAFTPHFTPHITLARRASASVAGTPPAGLEWRSSRIVLVQSETLAPGAHYRILATRTLVAST